MKRPAYVDEKGNKIADDEALNFRIKVYFVIGTIIPVILLFLIGYKVISNMNCNNIYNPIKKATYDYLESKNKLPNFEGESKEINVTELYENRFLGSYETNNIECSGKVKVTKYKTDYIYTLDLTNCKSCTTSERYGKWSNLQNSYPRGKAIVDVVPYYNYYDVEIGVTDWTRYYDEEELTDTIDKNYKTRVPKEEDGLPEVPSDVKIKGLNTEQITLYSHQDKTWKWYDIVGNYSKFSSEQPIGYEYKDEDTEKYTEWSDYDYSAPEEKEYRTVEKKIAYKYYYLDENEEKVYYNNGKYAVEADTEKYPLMEEETNYMYRYRDKTWRWYNGEKRSYSRYTATMPDEDFPHKDTELYSLGSPSDWEEESELTYESSAYRVESTKVQTRFQIEYELRSLPIFKNPLDKDTFIKRVGTTVPKFAKTDGVSVEVSYKFRYRKS